MHTSAYVLFLNTGDTIRMLEIGRPIGTQWSSTELKDIHAKNLTVPSADTLESKILPPKEATTLGSSFSPPQPMAMLRNRRVLAPPCQSSALSLYTVGKERRAAVIELELALGMPPQKSVLVQKNENSQTGVPVARKLTVQKAKPEMIRYLPIQVCSCSVTDRSKRVQRYYGASTPPYEIIFVSSYTTSESKVQPVVNAFASRVPNMRLASRLRCGGLLPHQLLCSFSSVNVSQAHSPPHLFPFEGERSPRLSVRCCNTSTEDAKYQDECCKSNGLKVRFISM